MTPIKLQDVSQLKLYFPSDSQTPTVFHQQQSNPNSASSVSVTFQLYLIDVSQLKLY